MCMSYVLPNLVSANIFALFTLWCCRTETSPLTGACGSFIISDDIFLFLFRFLWARSKLWFLTCSTSADSVKSTDVVGCSHISLPPITRSSTPYTGWTDVFCIHFECPALRSQVTQHRVLILTTPLHLYFSHIKHCTFVKNCCIHDW